MEEKDQKLWAADAALKTFRDGRTAEVVPLTFGRARIIVWTRYPLLDDSW